MLGTWKVELVSELTALSLAPLLLFLGSADFHFKMRPSSPVVLLSVFIFAFLPFYIEIIYMDTHTHYKLYNLIILSSLREEVISS